MRIRTGSVNIEFNREEMGELYNELNNLFTQVGIVTLSDRDKQNLPMAFALFDTLAKYGSS